VGGAAPSGEPPIGGPDEGPSPLGVVGRIGSPFVCAEGAQPYAKKYTKKNGGKHRKTPSDNTHSRAMFWAEPTVWDLAVQIKVKQIQIEQKYLLSYSFICLSEPKKYMGMVVA